MTSVCVGYIKKRTVSKNKNHFLLLLQISHHDRTLSREMLCQLGFFFFMCVEYLGREEGGDHPPPKGGGFGK